MNFIKSIIVYPKRKLNFSSPKRMFRSKKDRSDPSSFSSDSDTSGSTHKTPTSILEPQRSGDDWSSDAELLQAFKVMDRDNDGMVSRWELEALLSRMGSREVVETMLNEVVVDHEDGCISVEELTTRLGSACETPAYDDELREAFLFFDTNQDGKITAEELLGFFGALGDDRCTLEDCQHMVAAVDHNGDGFVCFEDFSRMMDLHLLT